MALNRPVEVEKRAIVALLEEAYLCRVNDLKHSIKLAKQALMRSRKIEESPLIGKSLNYLALFAMITGDYRKAVNMSKTAIKIFEQLGNETGVADAKFNIASVYYKTDNFHLGLVNLIDCQETYLKYNDHHSQAKVQKSLGTIYEYFGDQKNAFRSYKLAISSAKKVKDLSLESNAYSPLSGIYIKQNKIKKALELVELAIAIKQQTNDIRGLAFAIYGRGKVYTATQQYDLAEQDYLAAKKIHAEMNEKLGMGMVLNKLGSLYVKKGDISKAKATLLEGIEFSRKYNIVMIKFKCCHQLYRLYKLENNQEKALEYLETYLRVKEGVINTQTLKIIENYELILRMQKMEQATKLIKEKEEIIRKKNIAEEAARVRQQFLSNMSHEIRTPLNAVITIASLLSEKNIQNSGPMLQSLKFSANNLLLIVNDILDFTLLDSQKVKLDKAPSSLHSLMHKTTSDYKNIAQSKGLDLKTRIQSDVNEFYELDDLRFSQIISNLLSNAIKFSPSGLIEITVEKLTEEKHHDRLRIRIKDEGKGIHKRSFQDIFQNFALPQEVTSKKHAGAGLGLAIVKKLLQLHQAEIQLESELGRGSTFWFDVDLKRCELIPIDEKNAAEILFDKWVLLVDDNPINLMVAEKLCLKWGMKVEQATNGFEALERTSAKVYDFVLMDIHMPEMNGFEATKLIRKKKNLNSNTPVFALTADITAKSEEDYQKYFNGFLAKPIEIGKLLQALNFSNQYQVAYQ